MKLKSYLNVDKLKTYIEDGYVIHQKHPSFPLSLYTYGRPTVFEDKWDDITTKTRCLIANDETGEIVARSFEKFFNINTDFWPESWLENLPTEQPHVFEKLDGSLGVLYTYNGESFMASKGSFTSDHAKWGTKAYKALCPNAVWPKNHTPVFEMICQTVQHHIVHYKDDGLFLTALINNDTGEELDYNSLYHYAFLNGVQVPQIYYHSVPSILMGDHDKTNEEGFVLSWPREGRTPLKVKVKFPEFLRKQRIINNTNPKDILDLMEKDYFAGTDSIPDLVADTTEVFQEYVYSWEEKINDEYSNILDTCMCIYNDAIFNVQSHDRKAYAEFFTKPDNKRYSGILFAMLDQDVDQLASGIWKLCKPLVKGQTGMKLEGDE